MGFKSYNTLLMRANAETYENDFLVLNGSPYCEDIFSLKNILILHLMSGVAFIFMLNTFRR